ncbi:hypothetical protein [Sneathiella chinensis]|uniref:Lipoprotein n=1 Tax=Sneathiella chinensis TaxID=349750 RepID=A0ABQ5U1E8_9PROT|nr:hypothetical protein [Sneathiella chinensis]GLQ05684.1 hypothetical protein GCM10007924_09050 [Sneathiella chinensis]
MKKFGRILKAGAVLAPVALTACSGSIDAGLGDMFSTREPLPCPQVAVLPHADAITIFRPGQGRDLVDVQYEGVIAPVSGECSYEDDDSVIAVDLILRIGAIKGPAATSQTQEFPYFIAVADRNKKILNKKVFTSPVSVPEGRRRGGVEEETVQRIPLPTGRFGPDYTIILGFQLTQEQLDYNRSAAGL